MDFQGYVESLGYKTGTVDAIVQQGHWVAQCPKCAAWNPVWRETPLLVCASCLAGFFPVRLPMLVSEIEAVLGRRPDVATRNWLPSETVADLIAENRAHGLE